MNDVTLTAIAGKLEKTDLWKIYFDIEDGCFVEFSEEYDENQKEESEEEVLQRVFEVEDNWQRYVPLPSAYDLDEHAMMHRFALKQEEKAALEAALQGSGALRHFRQKTKELGLYEAWSKHRWQEFLSAAEEWCLENGISYRKE